MIRLCRQTLLPVSPRLSKHAALTHLGRNANSAWRGWGAYTWRAISSCAMRPGNAKPRTMMSELHRGSIADLNDAFRRSGPIMATPGITDRDDTLAIMMAVRTFDDFTADNDPYGEHDFGSFDWHQETIFWKIDYYDQNLEYGEDPL